MLLYDKLVHCARILDVPLIFSQYPIDLVSLDYTFLPNGMCRIGNQEVSCGSFDVSQLRLTCKYSSRVAALRQNFIRNIHGSRSTILVAFLGLILLILVASPIVKSMWIKRVELKNLHSHQAGEILEIEAPSDSSESNEKTE
ncbi:MAG: hypothetical protein MHMPM18_002506 [Marteilia pararefringens]